jgi:hypothetical protein
LSIDLSQKFEKSRNFVKIWSKREVGGGHIHIFRIVPSPASDSDANISQELPLPSDISHFMGRKKRGNKKWRG